MIITELELQQYTQDFNEYELNTMLLTAAQETVENYLGYTLEAVDKTYSGIINNYYIGLDQHISDITSVKINGVTITAYLVDKNIIIFNEIKTGEIEIVYTTGYVSTPSTIKLAILQIATLKLMETGKKIGVTGIQNPDGVGNTFINYTSYDKYLKPLSAYRII